MAYPFVLMPTLRDFIERAASEFQVTHHAVKGAIYGPRRQAYGSYLRRVVDGKTRIAPLQGNRAE